MTQDGEINLDRVKATYSIPDIVLVDIRELNSVNESRLYFEIFFAIGLTLLGAVVTNFNVELSISALSFLSFGIFSLIRFILKNKKLTNQNLRQ